MEELHPSTPGCQYLWGAILLAEKCAVLLQTQCGRKRGALPRMCTMEMVTVMFGGLRWPPNISRPSEPLPGALCLTGKGAWGLSGPHSSSSAGSLS